MAERSADDITNIVRRLVGAMSNLPTNPNKVGSTPSSVRPAAGRSFSGGQLELNDRFLVPRVSTSTSVSSGRVIPRARSGRFVPYARGNTGGKAKSKSDHEVVFKDVCLLPNPGWSNVPRRIVKETLVRQNL